MVVAQGRFSRAPHAVWLGVAMCLAFVLCGPLGWRALVRGSVPRQAAGALAYGILGGVPALASLGRGETFLTQGVNALIVVALFWVGGWGLARDIQMEEDLAAEQARGDALRRDVENARILALRAQLDPHFLFNTLNAIAEWCREDPLVAERAILQLSGMLRTVLAGVGPAWWPLARELELVESLLDLHRVRDPGLFTLRREVADGLDDVEVPPLLLLPLVENAMTHGPSAGHRGEVLLSVTRRRIVIENPGAFKGLREGGTGIATAQKRLSLAYGDGARLEIVQLRDRTRCTVDLPERG